jgi:hypothetical protein
LGDLRQLEAIRSNSAVNRLIDGFDGERLPAINGGTLIWLQVSNS